MGIDSLTARSDKSAKWYERLFDEALKLQPVEWEERNTDPVHQRITFLYGTLYELDQLNEATFRSLHEMFGVATISAFEHLTLLIRKGKLVKADGTDGYLTDVGIERLNLPITFIHGEENACFEPESTKKTIRMLRERFRRSQYRRHEIPNYGHIDCIFGRNAHRDVFPHILSHLEEYA